MEDKRRSRLTGDDCKSILAKMQNDTEACPSESEPAFIAKRPHVGSQRCNNSHCGSLFLIGFVCSLVSLHRCSSVASPPSCIGSRGNCHVAPVILNLLLLLLLIPEIPRSAPATPAAPAHSTAQILVHCLPWGWRKQFCAARWLKL